MIILVSGGTSFVSSDSVSYPISDVTHEIANSERLIYTGDMESLTVSDGFLPILLWFKQSAICNRKALGYVIVIIGGTSFVASVFVGISISLVSHDVANIDRISCPDNMGSLVPVTDSSQYRFILGDGFNWQFLGQILLPLSQIG